MNSAANFTHIRTHARGTRTHQRAHARMHTRTYTCTHTQTHVHTYNTHTHKHAYSDTHCKTPTSTRTNTQIHTHQVAHQTSNYTVWHIVTAYVASACHCANGEPVPTQFGMATHAENGCQPPVPNWLQASTPLQLPRQHSSSSIARWHTQRHLVHWCHRWVACYHGSEMDETVFISHF